MKKTYHEHFDNINLKDDYKEAILQTLLRHDDKKKNRVSLRLRYIFIPICTLILFSIPFFMNSDLFDAKNSFTIEANEAYYKIEKSTIEILETSLISPTPFIEDNSTGEVWTQIFDAPLPVCFRGDTVKSVTYAMDDAVFYKINEGYQDDDLANFTNLNGVGGVLATGKEYQSYQVTNSDASKNVWWVDFQGDGAYGSIGNQIVINNEDQGRVEGLYAMSFKVMLDDPTLLNLPSSDEARKEVQRQIAETLNRTVLNVRVDYIDGTYETTQLKFHVNEEAMQITK